MKPINRVSEPSPYFRGEYRHYGKYQWNIKYYNWESDYEIESAQEYFFGSYNYETNSFDLINELIGREIKASIQGRSGGWLVIDSDLSESEFQKIDSFVNDIMESLSNWINEERAFQAEIQAEAEAESKAQLEALKSDKRVSQALELIKSVAGNDYVLMIQGHKLD